MRDTPSQRVLFSHCPCTNRQRYATRESQKKDNRRGNEKKKCARRAKGMY